MPGSYNIAEWLCIWPLHASGAGEQAIRAVGSGSGRMVVVWLIITKSALYTPSYPLFIHINPSVFNIQNRRHFVWCVYFKSFLGGVRCKDTFQFLVKWKIIPWYIHGYDLWSVFLAVNTKILYFDCEVNYFTLSFTVYDLGGGRCFLAIPQLILNNTNVRCFFVRKIHIPCCLLLASSLQPVWKEV